MWNVVQGAVRARSFNELRLEVVMAWKRLSVDLDQNRVQAAASSRGLRTIPVAGIRNGVCSSNGGQRRDRTADAGLFRAALYH